MKKHFGQTVASQDLLAVSMDVTSRHATVLHTQVVIVTTQDAMEPEKHFAVTGVVMALIVDATVNFGSDFMEEIGTQFFLF